MKCEMCWLIDEGGVRVGSSWIFFLSKRQKTLVSGRVGGRCRRADASGGCLLYVM